jgi:hypothetical protein
MAASIHLIKGPSAAAGIHEMLEIVSEGAMNDLEKKYAGQGRL